VEDEALVVSLLVLDPVREGMTCSAGLAATVEEGTRMDQRDASRNNDPCALVDGGVGAPLTELGRALGRTVRQPRRVRRAIGAGAMVLAVASALIAGPGFAHAASPDSATAVIQSRMTGCLTPGSTIDKIAVGDKPAERCSPGQREVTIDTPTRPASATILPSWFL